MRLLLDESVPKRLRQYLPNHSVKTVVEMGWGGIKNGQLLALAGPHFEAFITVDKNLPYQQNLNKIPIAIVVLSAISNELPILIHLLPKLETALNQLKPKSYVLIKS